MVSGLFEVLNRVFGMEVKERQGVDTWHESVRFFDIFDSEGTLRGSFYLDLYAREHKRGGAWMDECRVRRINGEGELQTPVAYLTCNFNRPVGNKPRCLPMMKWSRCSMKPPRHSPHVDAS